MRNVLVSHNVITVTQTGQHEWTVLGKQIGVMLFAWLAVKLRLADLVEPGGGVVAPQPPMADIVRCGCTKPGSLTSRPGVCRKTQIGCVERMPSSRLCRRST